MKIFWQALGAVAVTTGVLAAPSAALAADSPSFVALTERDAAGKTVSYRFTRARRSRRFWA